MKKKIDVNALTLGMYVYELDRPWESTPFMFQGFEITSEDQLTTLKGCCDHVYIDIIGTDSNLAKSNRAARPNVGRFTVETANDKKAAKKNAFTLTEDPFKNFPRRKYEDQTKLQDELSAVKDTHEHANTLVHEILEDVHLGQSINAEGAKKLVEEMAHSVLRNPDALVCYTHLKNEDEYTALHCLRVCILGLAFGRHLGLEEEPLTLLGMGCLLHDIGKMKVPNSILNKPARLTDEEFTIMKSHVPHGVEILENTKGIPPAAIAIARQHHERYSGSGYINHLTGDQISQFGLVSAIVDTYDAITSDRVYHRGISTLDALRKIYEWREKDFHPAIVEQFIQCIGVFPIGSVVLLNTGEIGVVITVNRERQLKPRVVLVLDAQRKPYRAQKAIDLAQDQTPQGTPFEIKTVLTPSECGINPTEYLPVTMPEPGQLRLRS